MIFPFRSSKTSCLYAGASIHGMQFLSNQEMQETETY